MALTDSFLATCRSAIGSLAELTTFRAALAIVDSGNRATRYAAWHATFHGVDSPALLLRKAIRDTISAQADIAGTLGPLDRESAVRTLTAEFVPSYVRPLTDQQENAALDKALLEDRLS